MHIHIYTSARHCQHNEPTRYTSTFPHFDKKRKYEFGRCCILIFSSIKPFTLSRHRQKRPYVVAYLQHPAQSGSGPLTSRLCPA